MGIQPLHGDYALHSAAGRMLLMQCSAPSWI